MFKELKKEIEKCKNPVCCLDFPCSTHSDQKKTIEQEKTVNKELVKFIIDLEKTLYKEIEDLRESMSFLNKIKDAKDILLIQGRIDGIYLSISLLRIGT